MNHHRNLVLTVVTLLFGTGLTAEAATTITLRGQATPSSPVIRLGDVAEIDSADQQQARHLATLVLMPAPAPGSERFLRRREVEDLLAAHGQDLHDLRLDGAGQVAIVTQQLAATEQAAGLASNSEGWTGDKPLNLHAAILAGHAGTTSDNGASATAALAEKTHLALERAIASYLTSTTGKPGPWEVTCNLMAGQIAQLHAATTPLECRGGRVPWTGRQRFVVSFATPRGRVQVPVSADIVGQPTAVAVAMQPIARGSLITAADVELQEVESVPASSSHRAALESLDGVIGMEARQTIQPGSVLFTDQLQPPQLVKRGEVIAVVSQMGGLRVRTTARALQNGVKGELIQVESLETRQRYDARVTAPREAAVFASIRSPVNERPELPTRVVRQ